MRAWEGGEKEDVEPAMCLPCIIIIYFYYF